MNSNNFEKKKLRIINLYKNKKFTDVMNVGEYLHERNPNDYQLIYILGLTSINLKKFIEAEIYFKKLISIRVTSELYYTLGNIQKQLKKFSEAIFSYEKSIELNPKFSEAFNNLANTKKLINKRNEAIVLYRKAINLKENNIPALFSLSTILKENNNFSELIEVYNKILKLDKSNIKTIYNLGSAYLFLGQISEGRKRFEQVLKIDNSHVPSYRNYISITKIDKKNKIFKKLENLDIEKLNIEFKILATNALSKGYFDLNNINLGFEYLNKSNSLKRQISKFSMNEQEKQFINIKNFFSDLENQVSKFRKSLKSKPVFIVGMPRSGTTLLEQVLASHSKIYAAGELNFLQKIIDKVGLSKPVNIQEYFEEIRNYYYSKISRISKNKFIIDKLPLNFRWIGFIIKAFPEAKIIHIQRNPMAVCWSNYKTHFVDNGMDFNLTQEDIAKYYALYFDLMKFWDVQFKNNFLNINYENFVQDFEKQTKIILKYLGLEWEKQIINYDSVDRAVVTASYQQVRGKIMKNTSENWKMYGENLKIMKNSLKDLNIKF